MPRRPSKIAMLRRLAKDLSRERGKIGVDAASAHMKYRRFFKTQRYIGIDIDRERLITGLQRHPEDTGILANLAEYRGPGNSVDLLVSSNTLHFMSDEDCMAAVMNFVFMVKPDGRLIITKHVDEVSPKVLELLQRSFEDVDIFFYKNSLSMFYESLFYDKGGKFTGTLLARIFTFRPLIVLLSWLEMLTNGCESCNHRMYISCTRKRTKEPENDFSLDGLTLAGQNFYIA